jgi:hypothetical protein
MIIEHHIKRTAMMISAAVGGMLIATISQLANAPSAHADDPITEMFDNVQATITYGEGLISFGSESLAAGDIPEALNVDLAGIEDLLFGPGENVFVDSVGILTNNPVDYEIDISSIQVPPTDLTDAVAEVQNISVAAQGQFMDAAQSWALGDYALAAFHDLAAANFLVFDAPNEMFIGLAEALFGI